MGSERDRAIVFEAWRQYEDDSTVGAEAKARAIIAAVDAQHPAPPRLFDVWEGGYVHYTRPEGDPLLDEARKRPGYSVRPHVEPSQHPAPALPRDVAMRIAEEVRWMLQRGGATHNEHLRAIVSRHLPTDEEREAERAVVEAAVKRAARIRAFGRGPVTIAERDAWSLLACDTDRACDRLLAIRAKRGAR